MNASHLLYASNELVENIDEVLESNAIRFVRAPDRTVNQGRKATDLIEIRCCDERGEVVLVIEKRRSQPRANLMLIPSRRFVFWQNKMSNVLSGHLAKIMYDRGASDT